MTNTTESWPAGQTYVFQGTVAEDATGGTHSCTLVLTPGAGNEFYVIGGLVQVGNTATAQTVQVFADDGSSRVYDLINANGVSATTANLTYSFPSVATTSAIGASSEEQVTGFPAIVSGTMRLIMRVQTTAVSVTQIFGIVCRLKGALPTATLADSVGTPILTTNTNRVF